ncbi:MAG: hypothetical protein M0027_10155, partial [Candidatus Dormibacteraeota bacterium]|nr:hypothetical protein [Candidatus Dormibacteraeota bacterium]
RGRRPQASAAWVIMLDLNTSPSIAASQCSYRTNCPGVGHQSLPSASPSSVPSVFAAERVGPGTYPSL